MLLEACCSLEISSPIEWNEDWTGYTFDSSEWIGSPFLVRFEPMQHTRSTSFDRRHLWSESFFSDCAWYEDPSGQRRKLPWTWIGRNIIYIYIYRYKYYVFHFGDCGFLSFERNSVAWWGERFFCFHITLLITRHHDNNESLWKSCDTSVTLSFLSGFRLRIKLHVVPKITPN